MSVNAEVEGQETLKAIFPDASDVLIQNALRRSQGIVDEAADLILSGQVIEGTGEQDDEALARQLQEQMDRQEEDNAATDAELAKILAEEISESKTQNDFDELLAQQLFLFHKGTPPVERKSADELPAHLQRHVKGETVPGFEKEFGELVLPPINETIDSPFGIINCGVSDLKMEKKVVLKPEAVEVTLNGTDRVVMIIDDISASVREFKWFYKKETFPKIEDDGVATAKFEKGRMEVTMAVSARTGAVLVLSSVFKIGQLGTKISFIYNLLISAFDKSIQAALEKEIAEMIEIRLKKESFSDNDL
ncbi:hypothetical protein PROFUN_01101 [Planoprotostelium fungivorum]|uniref:CUE domain-containing protein n=1 Tax=Planoprotostelium fungivorum TaxID=1890364 RepID=A0A2P6NCA1_9EUKA|nr:hypothetical protein PROFUN_01101 [Planoprotostelium fungivorum]